MDNVENGNEIAIFYGLTMGMKVKLARIAKGLRILDVASLTRLPPMDVTRLEKGGFVLPTHRKRILEILEIDEADNGEAYLQKARDHFAGEREQYINLAQKNQADYYAKEKRKDQEASK